MANPRSSPTSLAGPVFLRFRPGATHPSTLFSGTERAFGARSFPGLATPAGAGPLRRSQESEEGEQKTEHRNCDYRGHVTLR